MNLQNYILNVKPSNPNGTDWILSKDDEILKDKRNFISRILSSSTPNEFSRNHKTIEVENQGYIGSCVGMSGKVCMSDSDSYRNIELSAMWIYKRAQLYDVWEGENYSGTSISGACESLRKEGCCREVFYPYDKYNESAIYLEGAVEDASTRKIDSYYFIPFGQIPDRVEDVKKVLKTRSLWVSFIVKESFYNVLSDGIVKTEEYMESKSVGGHAVAVTGYKNINGKLYWECQNSWGKNWGNNGFFYMEHELLTKINTSGFYYLKHTSDDKTFEEQKDAEKSLWEKNKKAFYILGIAVVTGLIMLVVSFLVNN